MENKDLDPGAIDLYLKYRAMKEVLARDSR